MRFFYLLALAAGLVSCGQKATSPVELFNGEDLAGWVAVTADSTAASPFSVADGCIRVAGEPFGYLRTAEPYGDYRLHVEWRWIGRPSNSGLFQRIQEGDGIWPTLIECQLEAGNAGDLNPAEIRDVMQLVKVPFFRDVAPPGNDIELIPYWINSLERRLNQAVTDNIYWIPIRIVGPETE